MTPPPKNFSQSTTAAGSGGGGKLALNARVHFYFGNREAEINETKLAVCRRLIPNDEERRENIVDILPPAFQPLTLKSAAPQILAELGQESLFGDSRRIVVVHQIGELFSAWSGRGKRRTAAKTAKAAKTTTTKSDKPRKATEDEMLDHFLGEVKKLLGLTQNALIFIAYEDDAKLRFVNDKSPLVQALMMMGTARKFSAKSYRFELSDAVVARSLPDAMRVVTAWRREDRQAAAPVFRTLLDDVHLLIQAAIHRRENARLAAEPEYAQLLFPPDLKPNLTTIHEFRKAKYHGAAFAYSSLPELLEALRDLLDIQKALYPKGDEAYIPDVNLLIDVWLARYLGR